MARLDAIVRKYKGDLERLHRDSCLELNGRIIDGTPVGETGVAQGGWDSNGPPVLYRNYSFTNNVEYIVPLEYGHSQQAPNGMLRINVRNWPSIVKKQIKK